MSFISKTIVLAIVCSFAAGCAPRSPDTPKPQSVNISIRDVSTGIGSVNFSNRKVGEVYIWDRRAEKLARIGKIDKMFIVSDDDAGRDIEISKNLEVSISVDASFSDSELAEIGTEVAKNMSFVYRDGVKTEVERPISALIAFANSFDQASTELINLRNASEDSANARGDKLAIVISESVDAVEMKITEESDRDLSAGVNLDSVRAGLRGKVDNTGILNIKSANPIDRVSILYSPQVFRIFKAQKPATATEEAKTTLRFETWTDFDSSRLRAVLQNL